MKKVKKRTWVILAAVILAVSASFIANRRLTAFLDENWGKNEEFYAMGETIPFGENYLDVGAQETMDGYSLRVNSAEVLTREELLNRIGQSEEEVEALLGENISSLAEKVCLVSITLWNDGSDAPGVALDSLYCEGLSYELTMDKTLTILSNDFLLEANRDQMDSAGSSIVGVYLDPGEDADINIVYSYSISSFSKRHWDRLDEDSLWLTMTYYPVRKIIELTLR